MTKQSAELTDALKRIEVLESALGRLVRHNDDLVRRGMSKYKPGSAIDRMWKAARAALTKGD